MYFRIFNLKEIVILTVSSSCFVVSFNTCCLVHWVRCSQIDCLIIHYAFLCHIEYSWVVNNKMIKRWTIKCNNINYNYNWKMNFLKSTQNGISLYRIEYERVFCWWCVWVCKFVYAWWWNQMRLQQIKGLIKYMTTTTRLYLA